MRVGLRRLFEDATLVTNMSIDSPAALSGSIYGRVVKPANDFSLAKEWVDTCRSHHHQCAISNPKQASPKRLINVKGHHPRVVLGRTTKGDFATLSHCWGSKPIIQLTKKTEAAFGNAIMWDQLSKTFQDAIEITLWVSITSG